MSHPSLGLPPLDLTAGDPAAAARIRSDIDRLSTRGLESALSTTRGMRERYDEDGLRQRRHDAALIAERVALSVAAGDPGPAREWAEMTAAVYRRKQVPMDDLVALCNGLRAALSGVLAPAEMPAADRALDAAIEVYRWHRRLAGDARKKNALLQLLYKGG